MSSIIHVYHVQLRWSVSESITDIWHSRVSLPSWGDGKKGSSTFVYACDTFTSDFNLTIATIIWTKTSISPMVWAYDSTGLNLRNIFRWQKSFYSPKQISQLTDHHIFRSLPHLSPRSQKMTLLYFPLVVGQVSPYSPKAGIKWTKLGSCFPPPKHTFSMTKVTGPALMQGVNL